MNTWVISMLYGAMCAVVLGGLIAGLHFGFRVSAVSLVVALVFAMVMRAATDDCEEVWACGRGRVPDLILLGGMALLIVMVFPGIPLTSP